MSAAMYNILVTASKKIYTTEKIPANISFIIVEKNQSTVNKIIVTDKNTSLVIWIF
jgi:hypothetical protein